MIISALCCRGRPIAGRKSRDELTLAQGRRFFQTSGMSHAKRTIGLAVEITRRKNRLTGGGSIFQRFFDEELSP